MIYLGDCLEIIKKVPKKSVDMVLCDLPYYKVVKNDWDNQWKSLEDYLDWVHKLIIEYNRVLKDDSNIFLFTSRKYNRNICFLLDKYFEEKRIIIWKRKRGFNNTRGKALSSSYEPICYFSKGNSTFNSLKIKLITKRKEYSKGFLKDGVCLSDVWDDIHALPHNSKEKLNHPTQKPIKLIKRIISIGSKEDDTILDTCAGSGTTGVCCQEMNRRFILIENEENYFNIIKERLNK